MDCWDVLGGHDAPTACAVSNIRVSPRPAPHAHAGHDPMDVDMDALAMSMAAKRTSPETSLLGGEAVRESITKAVAMFNQSPKKTGLLNTVIKHLDSLSADDAFKVLGVVLPWVCTCEQTGNGKLHLSLTCLHDQLYTSLYRPAQG